MHKYALAHLGYVVRRLEPAIRRFQEEGGELLLGPIEDPMQGVEVAVLAIDGGARVELVAPLDAEDNPVKGRLSRGGGLDHVCYEVPDLEAALAREQEAGALLVREPRWAVAFQRRVAFVQRRSGLVVELMHATEEPPPPGESP